MKNKTKFNLLLSNEMPVPANSIYDSSAENVDARRSRLIGDLAVECIHTHAFLNGLNIKTGMDVRFNKIKDFVHNRFIKKTVQLLHDLEEKQTITSSVRHALEDLKKDCERPEFYENLARLRLDSATKYNDLLNADIVYLGTGEKIKFADYVNNKDLGFSTILSKDVMGEKDENILRDKIVNLCIKWIDALYVDLAKKTFPKKGSSFSPKKTGGSRFKNFLGKVREKIGNALIVAGNSIKGSSSGKTDSESDSEIEIET